MTNGVMVSTSCNLLSDVKISRLCFHVVRPLQRELVQLSLILNNVMSFYALQVSLEYVYYELFGTRLEKLLIAVAGK